MTEIIRLGERVTEQVPPGNSPTSRFMPIDLLPILRMNIRLILISAGVALLFALIGTLMTTRQYKATALLQLIPSVVQEMDVGAQFEIEARGFQEVERYYRTQLELMRTRALAVEVVRRYRKMGYDDLSEDRPEALWGMLTVNPRERSQLIEISVVHRDPQRAAVLATLVAEVYVDQNLESRHEASAAASKWLEKKIAEYEVKVATVQAELLTYKKDHDLVDVEEKVTALSSRMSEVDERFGSVTTDRVLLQTQIDSYTKMLDAKKYAELADVLATPTLQSLSRMYAEARTEHAGIAARYGEKHSQYAESQDRLTRLVGELRRETKAAVEAEQARLDLLVAQEESLTEQIDSTRTELLGKQERTAEYEALKLELERNETFLKRLTKRSDELDLLASTQLNNAQVREEAVPPAKAFKPKVFLNLGLGLFTGLLAGCGLALLRYYIDDTVSSPLDITGYVGLPFLGVVPQVPPELTGQERDLYTVNNPQSLVAESIRGLRTILELSRQTSGLRKLMVTSSVASEGKTGTCVRLGIAFAQFGKRVVVVDCDHRRARVHKVFGTVHEVGLLSTLHGHTTLDQAIKTTPVPGLFVLPMGPRSDQASQLLASNRMERLLDELAERFDLVIVDTPPAATVTEAVSLSKMVDGVVMIIRAGAVSRTVVRHTVDRFRQVDAEFVGAILNSVDVTPAGRYGLYGYLYGYKYYPYYYSNYYGPDDEGPHPESEDKVAK